MLENIFFIPQNTWLVHMVNFILVDNLYSIAAVFRTKARTKAKKCLTVVAVIFWKGLNFGV
jgi:hypothetical protein